MFVWANYVSSHSVHSNITLADFKRIFYMEYLHRMWGRSIGVFFAAPAVFFFYKKWLPQFVKPRIGVYAGLILLQVIVGKMIA